jgi:hypothetical protein
MNPESRRRFLTFVYGCVDIGLEKPKDPSVRYAPAKGVMIPYVVIQGNFVLVRHRCYVTVWWGFGAASHAPERLFVLRCEREALAAQHKL